jgi:hypothetical protein
MDPLDPLLVVGALALVVFLCYTLYLQNRAVKKQAVAMTRME